MNIKTEKPKTKKRTTTRPFVYVAIIICFVTGECGGKLIKTPVNVTVSEGERKILECVTDFHDLKHTVFWKFENEDIFYGGEISMQYTSKFGIQKDHTKGIYNLIIRNATKSHNGRYTCADDEGEGEKSYAWVTWVAVFTESPTTEAANGNSSASTGTGAMPIIIIVVSIAVVVIIAVVICILKWKKRRSHNNGGLQENGEPSFQILDTSVRESKNENVITDHLPNPAKRIKEIERKELERKELERKELERKQAALKKTGNTRSTACGLNPENPKQTKKPEEISETIESKDNAEPVNATVNGPLTSDLSQEKAESNSKHTEDKAMRDEDDPESVLLQNKTTEQNCGAEDINDEGESPSDKEINENTHLWKANTISDKDNSSNC